MYEQTPERSVGQPGRRRDTSPSRERRAVRLAANDLAATISAHTRAIARYRALAGFHRPDERELIVDGCREIVAQSGQLRMRLADLRAGLPERLRSHSRLVDLDRALDALELAVDDVLDVVAG